MTPKGAREIAAIGRARGLTVDVGVCPACRERGGGWVWMKKPRADWPTGPGRWLARRSYHGFRVRFAKAMTYLANGTIQVVDEPKNGVATVTSVNIPVQYTVQELREAASGDGDLYQRRVDAMNAALFCEHRVARDWPCIDCQAQQVGDQSRWPTRPDERWWHAIEACPECTVTDAPSGRRVLTWDDAIDAATDKPWSVHRWQEDHGELGLEPREEWYPHEPGDPAVRAALTVVADRLQSHGDPLGLLVIHWLAGPCTECDGIDTRCECPEEAQIHGAGCWDCQGTGQLTSDPCGFCGGSGTMLGHVDEVLSNEYEKLDHVNV